MLHPKVTNFIMNRCGHYDARCYIFFSKVVKYQRCAYLPYHTSSIEYEPECNIWQMDKDSINDDDDDVNNDDAWYVLDFIRNVTHVMIRDDRLQSYIIEEYVDCSEHSKVFLFHNIISKYFKSNFKSRDKMIIAMHFPSNIMQLKQSLQQDESLSEYLQQIFFAPTFHESTPDLSGKALKLWNDNKDNGVLILPMNWCNHPDYETVLRKYLWDQEGNAPRKLFYSPSQSCYEIRKLIRMLSPIQVKSKTQINMVLGHLDELNILKGIHFYNCMLDEKNIFGLTNIIGCYYNEWNVVSNNTAINGTKINLNDVYVEFPLPSVMENQYLSYKTFLCKQYHNILVGNNTDPHQKEQENIFQDLPFNIIDDIFLKTLQECPLPINSC